MISDMTIEWSVGDCNCANSDICSKAFIEPHIVGIQGVIERDVAEHIVTLHNGWLKEQIRMGENR